MRTRTTTARTTTARTTATTRKPPAPAPRRTWRPGFSPGLVRWPGVRGSAAKQGVQLARRYPRASLASGLSAVILAGVMVLQPGKGKNDTTVAIPGAAAASQTASTASKACGATLGAAPETRRPRAGLGPRRRPTPIPPVGSRARTPKAVHVPARPGALADEAPPPAPVGEDVPGTAPRRPPATASGRGHRHPPRARPRSRTHRDGPVAGRRSGEAHRRRGPGPPASRRRRARADPAIRWRRREDGQPAPAPHRRSWSWPRPTPSRERLPGPAPAPRSRSVRLRLPPGRGLIAARCRRAPAPPLHPLPAPVGDHAPGSRSSDAARPGPRTRGASPARRSRLPAPGAGTLVKDTAAATGKAAGGTAKAAAVAGGVGLGSAQAREPRSPP